MFNANPNSRFYQHPGLWLVISILLLIQSIHVGIKSAAVLLLMFALLWTIHRFNPLPDRKRRPYPAAAHADNGD